VDPRGFPTSLPEFQRVFPNDRACATYLERLRWPEGFACPKCGVVGEPYRFAARPGVMRCRSCKANVSLTAGTVMHDTHLALTRWFRAAWLVTRDPRMTAADLMRELDLTRHETAHSMRRALLSAGRREWRGLHSALGIERGPRRGPKPTDLATRFGRMVSRTGPVPAHRPDLGPCHLWTGARDPQGYGRVTVDGKTELATHVAWRLAHGRDPIPCALHHCDNPPCVKALTDEYGAAHLFEGTRPENTADMIRKRRGTPRMLSEEQVADILASHARGDVQHATAVRLGITDSLVSRTIKRARR
jgi:hypothetical protein